MEAATLASDKPKAKNSKGKQRIKRKGEVEVLVKDDNNPPQASVNLPEEIHTLTGGDGNKFRVTIQGDRSLPALFTVHDIGLNHDSCFSRFLSFMTADGHSASLGAHFCIYHLDAPGHEPGYKKEEPLKPYTLDDMAAYVHTACTQLQLQSVFGFGVGAGASVLLKFAIAQPRLVEGLILCSPVSDKIGWGEWTSWKILEKLIGVTGITNFVKNQLFGMYFSAWGPQEGSDLYLQHTADLLEKDSAAVLLYMQAFSTRQDFTADVSKLRSRTLVFAGVDAYSHFSTLNVVGAIKDEYCQYVTLHKAAHLVLDEQPTEIAKPVRLYFRGFGINMR